MQEKRERERDRVGDDGDGEENRRICAYQFLILRGNEK